MGLVTLHLRHTSASLLIQENADPDVRLDFERFFARLVPDGDPLLKKSSEYRIVGHPQDVIDARDLVTGKAQFGGG